MSFRLRHLSLRLLAARAGVAATEAALMIGLLLLPMGGIAIEGTRFKQAHDTVQESLNVLIMTAGHAPTTLATKLPEYRSTVEKIAGAGATVTGREFCLCTSDLEAKGLAAPERSCTATCPPMGGIVSNPGQWVEFTVKVPYSPIVSFGPLTAQTLNGKARVRQR
jgi:hypothetical protein